MLSFRAKLNTLSIMIGLASLGLYSPSAICSEPDQDVKNPKVEACTSAARYAWPDFLLEKIEAKQLFNSEDCVIKSPTGKLLTEEELVKLRKISYDKCMAFTKPEEVEAALSFTKKQFYCVSQSVDIRRENCKQAVRYELPNQLLSASEVRATGATCAITSPKGLPLTDADLKSLRSKALDACLGLNDDTKIVEYLAKTRKQYNCAVNNDPNAPQL